VGVLAMKKIISFSIIAAGTIVSIFILNLSDKNPEEKLKLSISTNQKSSNLDFNSAALTNNAINSLNNSEQELFNDNFTDKMAQLYLRQIVDDNKGELKQIDGKNALLATPIDEIINKNPIDESIYKIQYKIFTAKEIIINDNNSKEAQLFFLNTLKSIQEKNLSKIKIKLLEMTQDFFQRKNTEKLEQYVQAGQKITIELLKTPTPSQWANVHLQNLNLWQKKITTLKALLDYENDPIKAIVALNELPQLIEETGSLEQMAAEKFKILASQ